MKTGLHASFLAMIVAGSLASSACEQIRNAAGRLGALDTLSSQIHEKFGEPSVSANLVNGDSLTIDLVNSNTRTRPESERQAIALDIARYAYSHFESRDRLVSVRVRFVRRWSIVVFKYSDATDLYSFEASELATVGPRPASPR